MRAREAIVGMVLAGVLSGVPSVAAVDAAADQGTALMAGIATVGDSIGGGEIPQSGMCNPTGKGLHFLGAHGGSKLKDSSGMQVKTLYYRLSFPAPNVTAILGTTDQPLDTGAYTGSLNVCGRIGPGPGGIGAACDWSGGTDGRGKLTLTNELTLQDRVYDLGLVGWPATTPTARVGVGRSMPISGEIRRVSPVDKSVQYSEGELTGLMTWAGSAPCSEPKPGGARTFTVNGALTFVTSRVEP